MPATIDIGLLEYPGAQEAALFGLTDLFEIANRPDRPRLSVRQRLASVDLQTSLPP